jgi:hypothetical protein
MAFIFKSDLLLGLILKLAILQVFWEPFCSRLCLKRGFVFYSDYKVNFCLCQHDKW